MAQTPVPNATRIDTETYPLFVPNSVMENPNADEVFQFLVTAWVFTAWLKKRFPKADVMDCSMLAGMAAWRPTTYLIPLMKQANDLHPNRPKAQQNLDMLVCIDNDFTLKKEATVAEFEEAKAYNEQALEEVEALFPCVCGECPDDLPPKEDLN